MGVLLWEGDECVAFGISSPSLFIVMSQEVITAIARKHLKLRKSLGELVLQISLVDRGIRMGFICGPQQPQFVDLQQFVHHLHLEKVISDSCKIVAFHSEICIVNVAKILDALNTNLPIFINVSGNLKHPVIMDNSSEKMQQFFHIFREKISQIAEDHMEFPSNVSLSAVLGLLGGYPVVYWCDSDTNCLSLVPLRQFRASLDGEDVLSFTVPEILTKNPEIRENLGLWKNFMGDKGVTVQETIFQELSVVL